MSGTQQAPHTPKSRRRWFQFSLRSLLLLVFVMAIPCSWYAVKLRRERQRLLAMDRLEQLGCGVGWTSPSLDGETRKLVYIHVQEAWKGSDSDLTLLQDIYDLWGLLLDDPDITAAGLQHLMGLTKLEHLLFEKTRATDESLAHVRGLTSLSTLALMGPITDRGITHLERLSSLQELSLEGTRVSDRRVEQLFAALPRLKTVRREPLLTEQQANIVEDIDMKSSYPSFEDIPVEGLIQFWEDFLDINISLDEDHQAVRVLEIAANAKKGGFQQVAESVLVPLELEAVIRPTDLPITSKDKAARLTSQYSYVKWSRVGGKVTCERGLRILLPDPQHSAGVR